MHIYVFEDVDELTTNYHAGGGLVVVARDKAHAKELIKEHVPNTGPTPEDWDQVDVYPTTEAAEPKVYIFPDAGCC